jgi:uncharacterized protein involved in exopolysaccharide biosynthesis
MAQPPRPPLPSSPRRGLMKPLKAAVGVAALALAAMVLSLRHTIWKPYQASGDEGIDSESPEATIISGLPG